MGYFNFINELKIVERKYKGYLLSELLYDNMSVAVLKSNHHLGINDFLKVKIVEIDEFYSKLI